MALFKALSCMAIYIGPGWRLYGERHKGDRMFEIKQLKYFVVSADMGSFTAAARILYTTQTNVSKTIGNTAGIFSV